MRRRSKLLNNLLGTSGKDEIPESSGNDQEALSFQQRAGKPPTDPRSLSAKLRERSVATQLPTEAAQHSQEQSSAAVSFDRPSPKSASPIKRVLGLLSSSPRTINFDDSDLQPANKAPLAERNQPDSDPDMPAGQAKAVRSSSTGLVDHPPELIRARAASLEGGGRAALLAVANDDDRHSGPVTSWLTGPRKNSPLYNRLPSDDWETSVDLAAEDSAMDVGYCLDPQPVTPLHDGLAKLSAIASSAKHRSASQSPAIPPQQPALPHAAAAQGLHTPSLATQRRDADHRQQQAARWQGSAITRTPSATSLRHMGPVSQEQEPEGVYDIFEPRAAQTANSAPSTSFPHHIASLWLGRDLEAVKNMTGAPSACQGDNYIATVVDEVESELDGSTLCHPAYTARLFLV